MNLERAGLRNFLVEQCILVGSAASEQGPVAPVIPIGVHTSIDRPTPSLASYDPLLENTR